MERLDIPDQLNEPWMIDGNCRGVDPAKFILEKGQNPNPAKAICAGCFVSDLCLDYAMKNRLDGIYAGTSTSQRKRLRSIGYVGIS